MEDKHIKILLIEDNAGDARLIRDMLREVSDSQFKLVRVESLKKALKLLGKGGFDVVVLDLGLPDSWGFDTFIRLRAKAPRMPVVVLTDLDDDVTGIKAVRAGAQDYLTKGQIDGKSLGRVIRYAVERKNLREGIRQSEEKMRFMIEKSPDFIMILDRDAKIQYINHAVPGYKKEDLIGKDVYDFIAPESQDKHKKLLEEVFLTGKMNRLETSARFGPDNTPSWYEIRFIPISDDNQVICAMLITSDLTGRKQSELVAREERKLYKTILDTTPGPIVLKDREGVYQAVNLAFCRFLDKEEEEIIGTSDFDLFPYDEAENFRQSDAKVMESGKLESEYCEITGAMDKRWLHIIKIPVLDMSGLAVGVLYSVRDVSDEGESEKELKKLEKSFIESKKLTGDIVMDVDEKGKWTFLDDNACEFFGESIEDLLGVEFTHYLHPSDAEKTKATIQEMIKANQKAGNFINRMKTPRGWRTVDWNVTLIFDDIGNYKGMQASGRDITGRKRAGEGPFKSEDKYSSLVDQVHDGIVVLQGGILKFANNAFSYICDYPREKMLNNPFLDLVAYESRDLVVRRARSLITGEEVSPGFEIKILRKDGTVRDIEARSTTIQYEGELAELLIVRDITEKKKIDEVLRKCGETAQALLNAATDLAYLIDTRGTILAINEKAANMIDKKAEELVGKVLFDSFPPDLANTRKAQAAEVSYSAKPTHFEEKQREGIFDCFVNPILNVEGKVELVAFFIRDVTERKKGDERVWGGDVRQSSLVDQVHDGVVIIQNGVLKFANIAFSNIFGSPVEEMLDVPFLDMVAYESRDLIIRRLKSQMAGELQSSNFELKIRCKDGKIKDVEARSTMIQYGGSPAELSIVRDITEKKKVEEVLRKSEKTARMLLNATTDLTYLTDTEGTILAINEKAARMIGVCAEELIGKVVFNYLPPDIAKSRKAQVSEAVYSGKPIHSEEKQEGIIYDCFINPIPNTLGRVELVASFIRDVTDQRRSNVDVLQQSDEAREPLFVEQVQDGVVILQGGVLKFANNAFAKIYGCPVEEILDIPFLDLVDHESRDLIIRRLTSQMAGEQLSPNFEIKIRCKEGAVRDVELRSTTIQYEGRPAELSLVYDITDKKKSEEALRKSEESTKALLNATTDLAYLTDTEGTILTINEKASQMVGKSIEELIGQVIFDYLPPDIARSRKSKISEVVNLGKPTRFKEEYEGMIFDCFVSPISNACGNVEKLAFFVRDVTGINDAGGGLLEGDGRFSAFMESSPDSFALLDSKLNYININKAGLRALGKTREEVIGKNILDINPSLKETGKYDQYLEVLKTGKASFIDDSNSPPKFGYLHSNVKAFKVGNFVGVIVSEVAESEKTERQIGELEDEYEQLFNSSHEGLILTNANGKLTWCNPVVEKISGYKPEELEGKMFYDLVVVDPKNIPTLIEFYEKGVSGNGVDDFEMHFKHKDGAMFWLSVRIRLLRSDGKLKGFLAICNDITENKRAQEEIEQKNVELRAIEQKIRVSNLQIKQEVEEKTFEVKKRLKHKDELINQLGQDMESPLVSLTSLLSILERKEDDLESRELLEKCILDVEYIKNLVLGKLQLETVNSEDTVFDLKEINLSNIVDSVLSDNKAIFDDTDVKIENKIRKDVNVFADKKWLKEVFNNFVTNASRFIGGDRKLTFDIKEIIDGFATISARDTGIDLDGEEIARIFEEFQKTDRSKYKPAISGLYFPVLKHIVERHGGYIWAESSPKGKGTTFYFTIPERGGGTNE